MELRDIILCATDSQSFVNRTGERFGDNAEFISSYITKAVRKLHFKTDETFNILAIQPSFDGGAFKLTRYPYPTAEVFVPITVTEWKDYLSTTPDQSVARYEFALSVLERGYRIASKYKDIPVDALLGIHDEFRKEGYRNEWTFFKKRFKEDGVSLYLRCYFTAFDFRLYAELYDYKESVLLDKQLCLRTFPSDVCFYHQFRKVVVLQELIMVKDFLGYDSFIIERAPLNMGRLIIETINCIQDDSAIERITW